MRNLGEKFLGWGMVLGVFSVVGAFFFWVFCLTFVNSYELGYAFNYRTGQLSILPRTGLVMTSPLTIVHTVDLRPVQVCITGGSDGDNDTSGINSRVLNCKLVRFNRAGLTEFLSLHGRNNYDQKELRSYLRIYAYDESGRHYPFLTILQELGSTHPSAPVAVPAPAPAGDAGAP